MGQEEKAQFGKDLLTPAEVSRHLAEARLEHKDWSGMPVPVMGLSLVLEPRYEHQHLNEFRWKEYYDEEGVRHTVEEEPPPQLSEFRVVNSWWSADLQATVKVLQDTGGRAHARFLLENRLTFTFRTLEAAAAWPVEAEQKALNRLRSLIPDHLFDQYFLTGHFHEVSKRSQLTYLFRRGRPTVVLRQTDEWTNVLCALCLHPIGYYGDTWAGVMCPSDEVIAHLLMMRGSEEKFWANANQHPPDHPAAGL
jgi:hypothetical protein